jgi:hypothetical protein
MPVVLRGGEAWHAWLHPSVTAWPRVVYVERRSNTMAAVALALGIAGIACGLAMFIIFPLAWALGGAAIVLGFVARGRAKRDPELGRQTMATWAVICGLVSIALGTVGAVVVNNAANELDQSLEELEQLEESP